jgi:LEA14-like dessication related protein
VSASVPIRVPYATLITAIGGLGGKTEVEYTLRGDVAVPLQGGSTDPFRIPWSTTGTLPVVKAPKFSGASLEDPDLGTDGSASVAVTATVENPNGFEMNLDGLGYALEVGGVRIGSLAMDSRGAVGPGASRRVGLTGSVSAMEVVSGLLRGGRSSGVRVVAIGALRTPFGPLQLGE